MLRRSALLLALLGVALPALAAPQKFLTGEIEASAEAHFAGVPENGYAPVWVELRNAGSRPREVTIGFDAYHQPGKVRRRVRLDANERRVVHLPVLTTTRVGELFVDPHGATPPGRVGLSFQSAPVKPLAVLGTEDQFDRFLNRVAGEQRPEAMYFDRPQLPDLLASYIGVRAVLLLDASAVSLEPSQRAALEAYALTGGEVVFALDAAAGPAALDQWRAAPHTTHDELGFGRVRVCPFSESCAQDLDSEPWTNRVAQGFQPKRRVLGGHQFAQYVDDDHQFGSAKHYKLLTHTGEPPVGAFLVIILLFATAIGPLNFLFARRHGRHLLLVTIPALALVTCTGIGAYGIASDGLFTVHERVLSATLLDSQRHQATTIAVTGVYAALSPGEAKFPAQHAFVPGPDSSVDISFDWTNGQAIGGDFIPSRSYRERASAAVQPTRARLTLAAGGVENALGEEILDGLARVDGRYVSFGSVPRDGRAPVQDVSEQDATQRLSDLAREFEGRFHEQIRQRVFGRLPAEGEFVALLPNSPFLTAGGYQPVRQPGVNVVRGRLER